MRLGLSPSEARLLVQSPRLYLQNPNSGALLRRSSVIRGKRKLELAFCPLKANCSDEQAMLDLALSRSSISIPVLSISARPFRVSSRYGNFTPSFLNLKTQSIIPGKTRRFLVFAEKNNGLSEPNEGDEREQEIGFEGDNNSGQDQPPIFNIRWNSLLAPDPDNILAIGLTGLLTWASVHVLFQLLFISLAILVGAVKYSIIATLLIFILITLL